MNKVKTRRPRHEILAQRAAGLTKRHEPKQTMTLANVLKKTKSQRKLEASAKAMKKNFKALQKEERSNVGAAWLMHFISTRVTV
jgi:hypothetical protein